MPRKSTTIRPGPLSKKEIEAVLEWLPIKSDKEIAARLSRSVIQISRFRDEQELTAVRKKLGEEEEYLVELRAGSAWTSFEKQFTPEELVFFERDYIEYRKQFKDVTATEIKSLHHMITLDILMQRCNIDRKNMQEEVDYLDKAIKREMSHKGGPRGNPIEYEVLTEMQRNLNATRTNLMSKTKEYKDLLEKHGKIMESLKATRMQRIKDIQDSGKFMGVLKRLEMEESRAEMNQMSGLMDLAIEKEKIRLARPHKYMDGMVDQPLLTPETVGLFDDNEEN